MIAIFCLNFNANLNYLNNKIDLKIIENVATMVKIFFNPNTPEEQVLFNFELRGYKKIDKESSHPDFIRLILPGKWPNQEMWLYHNRKNQYYWANINEEEHERFLCSRDVDLQKSMDFSTREISTQTD